MAHKNRRMLKEGPGAGYSIKSYVRISKVNSFELGKISAFRKSDYGYFAVTAEFNCDLDANASDLRFSSYEYGGEISSEVPVKISKMEMDFTVAPFSDIEDESEYREKMSGITEENVMQYVDIETVKETLIGDNFETDIVYGGGWMHATYDGTLSTMEDYVDYNNASYNDYQFAIDKVDAKITDEEVIKYVDDVVSGENYHDSFGVYGEDDELLDSFDDLDDAVEFAIENNGAYIECYTYEVKFGGELDFTSSVTVWYADDRVEESLKLREGNVNVSQEFVDKRDALADYLGIDKDKVRLTRFDDTFVTEDGDSYLVYTDDEATINARNAVTDAIDDIGFNSFSENFKNEVIRQQLVDTDWFDDAMKESYEFYADDIKEEDGEHGNRLFDEMIENGIISEEDVTEDGELVDSVDFGEAKEKFVEKLCYNWENGVEWFIDNFGEEEFSKVCTQHNLFDYDEIADMAVEWDGRGHFLSMWDGDELELPNGFYAYKQNENEDFDDADDIISESLVEKQGFVKKYKGYSNHDTGDNFTVTDEHGKTVGTEKTLSGCEGLIDEFSVKKSVNEDTKGDERAKTFKLNGITYKVSKLEDSLGKGGYVARWEDDSDNGLGYNNHGWISFDKQNYVLHNDDSRPIKDFIYVISAYDRQPKKSVKDKLISTTISMFGDDAVYTDWAEINEDTVKRNGKWANVGKDGKADSGKFKTKKEADAQRKAMYANGYKGESLEEAIHGKEDMETFLKMAKDIGINTLGELDTFLKNEKQPGDKDEWETMLRYRASLGNDFKIDPKKNEGLIDKIKGKIADAKKEKELKDTDDKKPPKQGQKIRVEGKEEEECDCEDPEYAYGDPEYDYEGELMDTDDDHGTESPYELGEEDFDDDFFADYWSKEESSIDYDDDFKVEEKCNKGGKLTESLHIKDGKYVNSNDDEEIGFYGYMLKNTMTGTDFLIYSTDKDDLNSGVKETIDYLVKGVGSEKELMDKNVYIACDEDTYGFDTFDVDEDGKVTVFGDAIALVGSDSIRF